MTKSNEFKIERWELGKKLFYDPILYKDGSVSCASYHDPSPAFSNDVSISVDANGLLGTRKAPSFGNVTYHPYFTREGVSILEMQILIPIQEINNLNNNIVLITVTLSTIATYLQMDM